MQPVEKLKKAQAKACNLSHLLKQQLRLIDELLFSLECEIVMLENGLQRPEVAFMIRACQVGAADKYPYAQLHELKRMPDRMIVGLETNDGRRFWFRPMMRPDPRPKEGA